MESTFLQNRLIVALLYVVVGAIITLLIQRILNKRGLFTYFVSHYRVGVSADDAIFGTVRCTWNDLPVANLYSSSVELRNESLKDYEDVIVQILTSDTALFSERTALIGTSRILDWTEGFKRRLAVPSGSEPTDAQRSLYASEREYLIPTLNRGQRVSFTYLNAARTEQQPTIVLDILHKGVKTKFLVAQPEFLGVPQFSAAQVGSVVGIVVVAFVIVTVETLWLAAVLSFLCGLLVLLPGTAFIKLWRRFRDLFGG